MKIEHGEGGAGPPTPDSYCERARLLLSLSVDGETTPDQAEELERHLPDCAECRGAQAVDLAVRAHMDEVGRSLPAGRMAERVVREALRVRREILATNRLLIGAAVLAGYVAGEAAGEEGHHQGARQQSFVRDHVSTCSP